MGWLYCNSNLDEQNPFVVFFIYINLALGMWDREVKKKDDQSY